MKGKTFLVRTFGCCIGLLVTISLVSSAVDVPLTEAHVKTLSVGFVTPNNTCLPLPDLIRRRSCDSTDLPKVKSVEVYCATMNHMLDWKTIVFQSDDPTASYTIVILGDGEHHRQVQADCRVAFLVESPAIDPNMYASFANPDQYSLFDVIFTHDLDLVKLNERFQPYIHGTASEHLLQKSELDNDWSEEQIQARMDQFHKKNKNVSMILSDKQLTEGHKMRHSVWGSVKDKGVDGFGLGAQGVPLNPKTLSLNDYAFHIVVENAKDGDLYMSEKLFDALLCGCIPLYWGSGKFVRQYFDGILFFETLDELDVLIRKINAQGVQMYKESMETVACNFRKALQLREGKIQKRFSKELIDERTGRLRCGLCPVRK
jgi:hypothetical protein